MSDPHSLMLDLAVRLAQQEAAGQSLTHQQRVVADIMWIGTQVSPNGFEGWLAYTDVERMRSTLEGLAEVGCDSVAELVLAALRAAHVQPEAMSDEEREMRVDQLTDAQRDELEELDGRFYEVYEPSMGLCEAYAREHGLLEA